MSKLLKLIFSNLAVEKTRDSFFNTLQVFSGYYRSVSIKSRDITPRKV